jgi:hypothetical protein
MPNVFGACLILYAHEGCDRWDAQAIVTVGRARWSLHTLCSSKPYGGIAWKTYLRRQIERGLDVRPRLEDPDHAEAEVAALLRAREAIRIIGRDTGNEEQAFAGRW